MILQNLGRNNSTVRKEPFNRGQMKVVAQQLVLLKVLQRFVLFVKRSLYLSDALVLNERTTIEEENSNVILHVSIQ